MGAAAAPIAIGTQIFGAAYSRQATLDQGRTEQNYYDFLADQNEERAMEAIKRGDQQVTSIQDTASVQDKNYRRQAASLEGSQKVAIAASGLASNSVTAEDVARDTMRAENIDETAIRYNADSKAWEARTAAGDLANNLRDQASQYRLAGRNARYASKVRATSSLLNSASSIASSWFAAKAGA